MNRFIPVLPCRRKATLRAVRTKALCAVALCALAAVPAAEASSRRVYINSNLPVPGLRPHMAYRPHRLRALTGDGSAYLAHIAWRHWNRSVATASARFYVNQCIPACAGGKFKSRRVKLTAWRIRTCRRTGKLVYTRLRIPHSDIGGGGPVLHMGQGC
jgi:hypothetical protein